MHKTITPQSKLLQKFILSFNVLEDFSQHGNDYCIFPKKGITILFTRHAQIDIKEDNIHLSKNTQSESKMLIAGRYLKGLNISYSQHVQEIAIQFTELGVNYFFPDYFSMLSQKGMHTRSLIDFGMNESLLFEQSMDKRIEYLENHLLNIYKPLNIQGLEKAVDLINSNPSIQTKDIAKQVFIGCKTLNRHFTKYMGCTSTEFKNVVKFRNAVNEFFNMNSKNLTELSYNNDYFDSSHFYKQINKITKLSPKDFFNQVQKSCSNQYPYISCCYYDSK